MEQETKTMVARASLRDLDWDPRQRRLLGYSEIFGGSFPDRIAVTSHHTGREIMFLPVTPDHPLFDEDGWDGEQMVYQSQDPSVDMVLFLNHAY